MLQSMRHLAQSWVVKGLMLILVVSFGIWGIGDIFRGNPLHETVAKAGDTSITVQQLNREFEQNLSQMRQMVGQDITAQQARQMGFLDRTLNAIVQRVLMDQETRRMGLEVDNKAVLASLAAQPQFRTKDGKFNVPLFRELLRRANVTEKQFMDEGREDMMRHQLSDVMQLTDKPADFVTDTLYKVRGQKRIYDVVTIKNNSVGDFGAPEDKVLEEYWKQHPESFTSPEYRSVTVALLSVDDVAKDIHLTDDQLKAAYDAKGDQLTKPERRELVQVLLQSEDQAKAIADAAKSGGLDAAAKAAGHPATDLGLIDARSMLPELAKPVFELKKGEVSAPIHSGLGWHVVEVKKVVPSAKPSFDEVKAQLRDDVTRDQAVEATTRAVNKLDDELAAGHALEDIADSLRLRLVKLPPVDAQGKTADGKVPAEFPHKDDVLKTLFGQSSGETSPILDDKKGNYFVTRTDDIVPSAVKPFDKVKTDVAAHWKADEQARRAAQEAEKVAKAIRDGKAPASFASAGVDYRESKPISLLGDVDTSLPEAIMPRILKLKKGEVTTSAIDGAQLVIRLTKIVDAAPADSLAAKVKITDELSKKMPNEVLEQYFNYLKRIYPVKIHQDVLAAQTRQGS